MEYGRLVVLGYSSYRVATVGTPPRSEASHAHSRASPPQQQQQQQQSFGLGVATGENSAQANGNGGGARASPGPSGRNGASTATAGAPTSGSGGPPASAPSRSANGNYSSSKKSLGQLWEPIGDQNAQYILQKRKRANGVLLSHFHHFCQKKALPTSSASVSASASSSPSSSPVTSKDIKVVTKRMMHAVDMKRTIVKESENRDTNGSSSDTATSNSSNSPGTGTGNGLKMPPTADNPFLMCVPMNDKDAHASITEYKLDPATDMFQIGRMPCRQNDFVIPGPRVGASGTISRFAARILCSREPPYECRIFAGGFDVTRKMSTAGHALKYCQGCSSWFKKLPVDHVCVASHLLKQELHNGGSNGVGARSHRPSVQASSLSRRESNQSSHTSSRDVVTTSTIAEDMDHLEMEVSDPSEIPIDGVTKNGVRVWVPEHKQWFEVSVNGNLYAIESRTAPPASSRSSSARLPASGGVVRHSTFNRPSAGSDGVPPILTDGAIIDLGGVQLQFQTKYRSPSQLAGERASLAEYDEAAMGRRTNSSVVDQLERLNIQCPVQLHSLRFTPPEPGEETDPLEIPHVFPACGHVFGYEERIANSRMCPLCRHPGFLVKLLLKDNSQLQSAAERNRIPECVLNPCGHAISSKLASYYSKLLMPNGRAICPFCAVHLHPTMPFSRLYLYSEESDQC